MENPILISNDDGPDCPLLEPFLLALADIFPERELQVAIPEEEKSWIAQAATLKGVITAQPRNFSTGPGFTLSGTPADCVTIAIQNLLPTRPTLCLSGINIGTNAGMAFYHNSGTVGAARQAVLCGVPGIAFSAHLPLEIFSLWRSRDFEALNAQSKLWNHVAALAARCAATLEPILERLEISFCSVNIPCEASEDAPLRLSRLARVGYNTLFQERGQLQFELQPSMQALTAESATSQDILPSDLEVMKEGAISVTALHLDGTALSQEQLHQFQQLLSLA